MNFPKSLLLALTLGLIFAFPLSGHAQKMEMTAASPQARVQMRLAIDIMGHDMPMHAKHIKKAYELDPNMPMAIVFSAVTAGNMEDSKAMADKMAAYEGKLTDGEKVFAEMMTHFGDSTYKASGDASQLLELYPQDAGLHLLLGFIYMGEEMPDKAIEVFDKAIQMEDLAGAYNMKGYAYMAKGQMDMAKASFDSYMEMVPEHPNPYDSMGDYYMASQDFKNAYEHFTKAAEMEGGYPESAEKAKKAKEMMDK